MFNIRDLTTEGTYMIQGERGEWHYSGISGNRYNFWRWAEGQTNRRVRLALSLTQAQRKVWQEVQRLNLGNLEAFRGE
jgi:hypothetical protein